MLDLARLHVLRALAAHGSLAAAADALRLTPSAVSQQMAKLEREAGCPLLERHGRGVRLTAEGMLLAEHAEQILGAVERAESALDERRGEVLGEVTVAAFPTAARALLPRVLVSLRERYPRLRTRLRECEVYDALPLVVRGDVDVAVAQDWANVPVAVPERLCREEIGRDPVDVALPASHPLRDRERLALADLADEVWISSTVGTICHDWLLTTCRNIGREPVVAHKAAEFPTQLALVAAGLGIALVPRLACPDPPDGVCLVPLEPMMSRRIFLVWREDRARRPAVRAVLDTLRAGMADVGRSGAVRSAG